MKHIKRTPEPRYKIIGGGRHKTKYKFIRQNELAYKCYQNLYSVIFHKNEYLFSVLLLFFSHVFAYDFYTVRYHLIKELLSQSHRIVTMWTGYYLHDLYFRLNWLNFMFCYLCVLMRWAYRYFVTCCDNDIPFPKIYSAFCAHYSVVETIISPVAGR